jgi:hypothetical protein
MDESGERLRSPSGEGMLGMTAPFKRELRVSVNVIIVADGVRCGNHRWT